MLADIIHGLNALHIENTCGHVSKSFQDFVQGSIVKFVNLQRQKAFYMNYRCFYGSEVTTKLLIRIRTVKVLLRAIHTCHAHVDNFC